METMFTEIEQETLDIDWFFTNHEYIGFGASGGGLLPASVAKSKENNELLWLYFNDLPERCETRINPHLNKIIKEPDERYLFGFLEMARRGIFAFDRTKSGNYSVAIPVNPIKIDELPSDLIEILSKTSYQGDMEMAININLFS
ncbi:MAG: hypothetical protein JWR38_5345 [Mucilaginibacter sp.]|nr:hypothetical protein [Mucilaginibacter sp.]